MPTGTIAGTTTIDQRHDDDRLTHDGRMGTARQQCDEGMSTVIRCHKPWVRRSTPMTCYHKPGFGTEAGSVFAPHHIVVVSSTYRGHVVGLYHHHFVAILSSIRRHNPPVTELLLPQVGMCLKSLAILFSRIIYRLLISTQK